MILWVLEFEIGDTKLYLAPDNTHSVHLKDALKFESESGALQYLHVSKTLFTFKPAPYSFEFAD